MSWVIIAWIALSLVAAFQFAARDQGCRTRLGLDRLQCQFEARIGFRGAIGWLVIGTIVLGVVWIVTQPRQRPRECPACGSTVPRGVTRCHVCDHDFAASAAGGAAPATGSATPASGNIAAPPPSTPRTPLTPPSAAPSGDTPPSDIPPPDIPPPRAPSG